MLEHERKEAEIGTRPDTRLRQFYKDLEGPCGGPPREQECPRTSWQHTPGDRHSAAHGLCCLRTVRHEATLTGPLDEYEDTVRVMADAFLGEREEGL